MSSSTSNPASEFGPNEWLVEEMYQRFLVDPDNVDKAWHEFFADYRSPDGDDAATTVDAPAEAAAPAPAQKPASEEAVTAAPTPTTPAGRAEPARPRGRQGGPGRDQHLGQRLGRRHPDGRQVGRQAGRRGELPRGQTGRRRRQRRDHPARRRVGRGEEHERVADRAHRDQRAGGAGQAAGRQPDRDQQPAQAHPWRQDLLHPLHRLRDRQGAGRLPGDEPALRRGRRQADTRARPST